MLQTKKKRKRCGECVGCQRKDNCGDCAPCRNDKSHQICKQRRCEKLTEKKVSEVFFLFILWTFFVVQVKNNDNLFLITNICSINFFSKHNRTTTYIKIRWLVAYTDVPKDRRIVQLWRFDHRGMIKIEQMRVK